MENAWEDAQRAKGAQGAVETALDMIVSVISRYSEWGGDLAIGFEGAAQYARTDNRHEAEIALLDMLARAARRNIQPKKTPPEP